MKIHTVILLAVLVAIAAFVALNWSTIVMPTSLSLGVGSIQAPLALLMLVLLTLFTLFFFVFVIYSKTSGFFKERLHRQEMETTQELADNAETSRFTELRELLGAEFKRQSDQYSELTSKLMARLEKLDNDFRSRPQNLRLAHAVATPGKSQLFIQEKNKS
jgi:ABC-type multidrug transport system fused ATPase/permease subunit